MIITIMITMYIYTIAIRSGGGNTICNVISDVIVMFTIGGSSKKSYVVGYGYGTYGL